MFVGAGAALEGHLTIEHTWDGQPVASDERVSLRFWFTEAEVQVFVDAPFFDDPAPDHAPGPTPGLWNHEVVEVFFLGSEERYLEVELGPHGHHLVLALQGVRQVVAEQLPLAFSATLEATGETAVGGQGQAADDAADDAAGAAKGDGAEGQPRRWWGTARFPCAWLPPEWSHLNAYAIHGTGATRRYLAWRPAGGEHPDFHVLSAFGEVAPVLRPPMPSAAPKAG